MRWMGLQGMKTLYRVGWINLIFSIKAAGLKPARVAVPRVAPERSRNWRRSRDIFSEQMFRWSIILSIGALAKKSFYFYLSAIRCQIFWVIAREFKKICLLKLRVKFGRFLECVFSQVGKEKIPSPHLSIYFRCLLNTEPIPSKPNANNPRIEEGSGTAGNGFGPVLGDKNPFKGSPTAPKPTRSRELNWVITST